MAVNLVLVNLRMRPRLGRRPYFTPEGKVALMFLKMYTQLNFPRLLNQLNGNIYFQIFCDIVINPARPLTNYKLLDDIASEIVANLKIQPQQKCMMLIVDSTGILCSFQQKC